MANFDCEDITTFPYMEEDSILDEFLFDKAGTTPSIIRKERITQEERIDLTCFESSKIGEKRLISVQRMKSHACCTKAEVDTHLEKSITSHEVTTDITRRNGVGEISSNSVMPQKPSSALQRTNPWWRSWTFKKPLSYESQSGEKNGPKKHKRYRHEVHKKLRRLHLQFLGLKTHSLHDNREGRKPMTTPQPQPPKKSMSVSVCCPGLSRMYCKRALYKRLLANFKIISKSKEKHCVLSSDLPENAYLLRWRNFIRLQKAKKKGLKSFIGSAMIGNKAAISCRPPRFLQGKLWYAINAKKIDFTRSVRMMYTPSKKSSRVGRVNRRLLRHVIQYMNVLQNYPELSWLSSSEKSTNLEEEGNHSSFTISHRTIDQSSTAMVWSHLKRLRGRLRCGDRYFLKRRFYNFQEWLNDNRFTSTQGEDNPIYNSDKECSAITNRTEMDSSKFSPSVKYSSNHSKRRGTLNNPRYSPEHNSIETESSTCLNIRENQEDHAGQADSLTEDGKAKLIIPTQSRIRGHHPYDRHSSKASFSCSGGSVSLESNSPLLSYEKGADQNNPSTPKLAKFRYTTRKSLGRNRKSTTPGVYRKPKRLTIPIECNPKRRSLYKNILKDTLFLCSQCDPRLTVSKRAEISKKKFYDSVDSKTNLVSTCHLRKTTFQNSMDFDSISLPTNSIQICFNECNSSRRAQKFNSSKVIGSEVFLTLPLRKSDNGNEPIEEDAKKAPVSTTFRRGHSVGMTYQEPISYDHGFRQNLHNYCSRLGMLEVSNSMSLTVGEVKQPLRLCHPSIRAFLTKQDTLELLDDLCEVVRPLSPLGQDKKNSLEVMISADKNPVGVTPYLGDTSASLDNTVGAENNLQQMGISEASTSSMQCTQASQCRMCGSTLAKVPSLLNFVDEMVAEDVTCTKIAGGQKSPCRKKTITNRRPSERKPVTYVGDNGPSKRTLKNARTDLRTTKNVSDSVNQSTLNAEPFSLPCSLDHTVPQNPPGNGNDDTNIDVHQFINKKDFCRNFSRLNCKLQCVCAAADKGLASLDYNFVGHLFLYKTKNHLSESLSQTSLNAENHFLECQHTRMFQDNSNRKMKGELSEDAKHSFEMPSDSSNNHGDKSTEEFPSPALFSKVSGRPADPYSEGLGTAAVDSEQDYICDNMSIPIVLSAADRVYHVNAPSYEQTARVPIFEMPSTSSISHRQANLDSTVSNVSCEGFLNEVFCGNNTCQSVSTELLLPQQENDEVNPNPDFLSRIMETAGLTDTEIETFLTSESTLDASFVDQSDFSLEAFLSCQQECSEQMDGQQTEQPVYFNPDLQDENFDNHQVEICNIFSHSCFTEGNRSEAVEKVASHIHLDTNPAMDAFCDAPTFQLGPQTDNSILRVDSSKEVFRTLSEVQLEHDESRRVACTFMYNCDLDKGACSQHINVNVKQWEGMDSQHAQMHTVDTKERENQLVISGKSMECGAEPKDCLDDSFSLVSSKEINLFGEETQNRIGNDLVGVENQISLDSECPYCIQNDCNGELETLDLQPLSKNLFGKETSEQEEEDEEHEKREGKSVERRIVKSHDLISHNNSEVQKDSSQHGKDGSRLKLVSSKPIHHNAYLWSSPRRKMMRRCMQMESLSNACKGLSHSKESELSREPVVHNPKSLIKARSLIKFEKKTASHISKRKNRRRRLDIQKGMKKSHSQNRKGCKSSAVLTRRKAAGKQGKDIKKIEASDASPPKSKLRPNTAIESRQSPVSGSSDKTESLTRTKALEVNQNENLSRSEKPASCSEGQTQVEECEYNHSNQGSTSVAGAHSEYENSRADVFSQQLCSFSPGFLKKVSQASVKGFLMPPASVNKIATKFPRPLVASRRPSALSQKTWRCRGDHNENNNSNEGVKAMVYPQEREVFENSLGDNLVKIERRNIPGENVKHGPNLKYSGYLKCPILGPEANFSRIIIGSNVKKKVHSYTSIWVATAHTFRGRRRDKAKNKHSHLINTKMAMLKSHKIHCKSVDASGQQKIRKRDSHKRDKNENIAPLVIIDKIIDANQMISAKQKSVLVDFSSAYNTNNNSNKQDRDGNPETEERWETKEQNTLAASSNFNTQVSSCLKRPIPDIASDSMRQKDAMKCDLPRIGRNMENFHVARRKLKEVNARLTKLHGKQNAANAPTSAPVFERFAATKHEIGSGKGRGEPYVEQLSSTQTLQRIRQRKGGLSQNISLNNIPAESQTSGVMNRGNNRDESGKAKRISSEIPGQLGQQRYTFGVPTIPKLQDSLERLKMNEKGYALLSQKVRTERKGLGDTLCYMDEERKGSLNLDGKNKLRKASFSKKGQLAKSPLPQNLSRNLDIGLARFVERLNSDYGQQLTNGNQEEQARLENLCSRYMDTMTMRKSLEKKITGKPMGKLDRNCIHAPLGMQEIVESKGGLQKRKRKSSPMDELHKDLDDVARREDYIAEDEYLTLEEKDTNENMKKSGKSSAQQKQHTDIILSRKSIFGEINSGGESVKKKSVSKLSLSGKSPQRKTLQVPERKPSPLGPKNIDKRQSARLNITTKLRTSLKESVDRLSSHPQSPTERLQYDISSWETRFGKSFNIGLFDATTAENRGRSFTRPANSSSNVARSPRPARQGSLPSIPTSPTCFRNIGVQKWIEKRSRSNSSATKSISLPNPKRPLVPKTAGDRKSKEEKINTFFGSLLNLIDQKEKQKGKYSESGIEAESKPHKSLQREQSREKSNKVHNEERRDKDIHDHKVNSAKKENTKGDKKFAVSSRVGTTYRKMLETIKAKRSSSVVDSDDPCILPSFPNFEEVSQSPEYMLNLPNFFPESGTKSSTEAAKSSDQSAKCVVNKSHTLCTKSQDAADESIRPSTDSSHVNKQSVALSTKLPPLEISSQNGPITNQNEGAESKETALSPDLKELKTESVGSNSSLKEKDIVASERRAEGASINTSPSILGQKATADKSLQLPKLRQRFCVEMKPPPDFVALTLSDSTTSICASRGGGDSGFSKDDRLSVEASPNVSFSSEFAAPVDVFVNEQNLKNNLSNDVLDVCKKSISPKLRDFSKAEPGQINFANSDSTFSTFGKDETVSWTELQDITKLSLEAPLYTDRTLRTRSMGTEDTLKFKHYHDKPQYHVSGNMQQSPIKERFDESDCGDTVMNRSHVRNKEYSSKRITGILDDTTSTDRKSITSYEKQDDLDTVFSFKRLNSDTHSSSYNEASSYRSKVYHRYNNRFSSKAHSFDSPRSDSDIEPLDTLDRRAEQNFEAAVYRRAYYDAGKKQHYGSRHSPDEAYSFQGSANNRQADSTGTYGRRRQGPSNSQYSYHTDHRDFLHNKAGELVDSCGDLGRTLSSHHESENSVRFPPSDLPSYHIQRSSIGDIQIFTGFSDDLNTYSPRHPMPEVKQDYAPAPRAIGAEDSYLISPRYATVPLRTEYKSSQRTISTDNLNLFSPRSATSPLRTKYSSDPDTNIASDANIYSPRHTMPLQQQHYTPKSEAISTEDPNLLSSRHAISALQPAHISSQDLDLGTKCTDDPSFFSPISTKTPQQVDYTSTRGTNRSDDANYFSPRSTVSSQRADYTTTSETDVDLLSPTHTLPAPSQDYASPAVTGDVLISEGPHESPYENPGTCKSADQFSSDIPWNQFASTQIIPLNHHSPTTIYDQVRRSVGQSYLAPIQEESEEEQ